MQFQDGGSAVLAFPVHGNEFAVKFYFRIGVGGPLLDEIGVDVVKSPDQYIEFHIGGLHVLRGKGLQGAFRVDGMHDGPVHREAFHFCPFKTEIIVPVFRAAVHLHLQADIHPDLYICQGVVVFIGGKAEHQRRSSLVGADQCVVTKDQESVRPGKPPVHQTGSQGKRQEAEHGFDGGCQVGAVS